MHLGLSWIRARVFADRTPSRSALWCTNTMGTYIIITRLPWHTVASRSIINDINNIFYWSNLTFSVASHPVAWTIVPPVCGAVSPRIQFIFPRWIPLKTAPHLRTLLSNPWNQRIHWRIRLLPRFARESVRKNPIQLHRIILSNLAPRCIPLSLLSARI